MKKLFSMMMAVLMVLAMAACGSEPSANGGNDFYESSVVHPDLVLRDLVKIFHPELVPEDFVYYQRLAD